MDETKAWTKGASLFDQTEVISQFPELAQHCVKTLSGYIFILELLLIF